MTEVLAIRIAGAVLRLEAASDRVVLGLPPVLQSFRCPPTDADMRFRVGRKNLAGARSGALLFDSGSLWQLFADKGEYELRLSSPSLGKVPYKIVRFDHELRRGEIHLHSGYEKYFPEGTTVDALEYPLGELIYLHWLAQGRGIEVHSCGIIDTDGKGYLFVGHSGAGKTTSAGLWLQQPGVEAISDDRVILRKEDGKLWMHGTPWHGTGRLASPRRAPLKAVFLLRHGPKHCLVPIRNSLAASRLLACSFVPLYQREGLAYSIKFLDDVVSSVPCAELEFTPESTVVEFVRQAVRTTTQVSGSRKN